MRMLPAAATGVSSAPPRRGARALQRLRHAREFAALVLGFASLGLGCLLYSALALALRRVLRGRARRRWGRRLATLGFRVYLLWLQIIGVARFDLRALDALRGAGPMVIVANHPGLIDALMLVSRLDDLACVFKASLLRSPFWGAGARLAGYIPNDWFLGSVNMAVEELRGGHQLLLFPEGTRTDRAPLGEFRSGAALVSHRAGVPIQTVLIEQDSGFLGKDWGFLQRPDMPVHYRVRLGRRFDPPADPRAFTSELRDYFIEALGA
jgi:1-acyl-sn-glycerol-3-phosphate acyltransferase